jgi:DNA-binding transcriptional LysR family regulator
VFAGRDPPAAPIECGSVLVVRQVLRDSDFLTLLSPDQVALEIEAGVLTTIGPPLPDSRRTIGITTRHGWRATSAQARFIELLGEAAETPEIE